MIGVDFGTVATIGLGLFSAGGFMGALTHRLWTMDERIVARLPHVAQTGILKVEEATLKAAEPVLVKVSGKYAATVQAFADELIKNEPSIV